MTRYRPDIDGLRAVAVLAVLAFHLGVPGFSGGFVGVDVFFVISGYLIGGIVLGEVADGTFRFSRFYARRFRRILPALVGLFLVASAAAWFVLLPPDLESFGKSLIAADLSVANMYFLKAANYFEIAPGSNLLLHTWSLGVEEQFYLVFPVFIVALHRLRPRWVAGGLALAAVLSLALSVAVTASHARMNFYTFPCRAWELLLGVLLAARPVSWLGTAPRRNVTAAAGLAAILCTTVLYSVHMSVQGHTPFPGLAALPPCLGAAAILAAGSQGETVVSRLLSLRPLVFVGLISYSLYLFHWPLLMLLEYGLPTPHLRPWAVVLTAGAAFLLATLSWYFVERPFRRPRNPTDAAAFRWSAGAISVILLFGLALVGLHGLPGRIPPQARQYARTLSYNPAQAFRSGTCFRWGDPPFHEFHDTNCLDLDQGRDPSRRNVLLLGNSHAADLWIGLSTLDQRVHMLQATVAGVQCYPVAGQNPGDTIGCGRVYRYIYDDFLVHNHVDLVILSATWDLPSLDSLRLTLNALRARHIPVLVLSASPEYQVDLPRLLAFAAQRHDPALPDRFATPEPVEVDAHLSSIAEQAGADFFQMHDFLCRPACVTTTAGAPLLFDGDHFTREGASLVASGIAQTPSWRALLGPATP